MKVLMISSDRNILVSGSVVSERMKEYGALVEELHIILLSDVRHGLMDKQLSENVWIYPTNSRINLLRPIDATRIGKKIIFEKKFIRGKALITTQDPFECGWAGMRVKKRWRIPLEVQLHTDPFSPYFKGFQNMVRKFYAKKVLHHADNVRVVSAELKSRILMMTKVEVHVLPIYVDKKKIEDAQITFDLHTRYPWRPILLAVSRLSPEKNLPLAFQVLALVREKYPNTGLVIVGSGPEEKVLKSKVKSLNLQGAVEFVGWQEGLSSFYKTANIFIQTSFFEGYGLSLIEAGLSSLPVITTPVGIALELENGKDVLICPVDHPELFAEAIIDLIENNYKRENLKINLKKILESKLLSKEEYLNRLKDQWIKCAVDNFN